MSWSVVFSSSQPHIVEIVKSILNEHGIKFVTMDKRVSMYKNIASPGIEVYIQSEDFIKTKNLLSEFETE
jgi:glycine cleavage system regulatory protein